VTLDVSRLAPSDAVAALRSFGRRFAAVLTLLDGEDEGVLHRAGPDGWSALDHADLAGRDLAVVADGLAKVLAGGASALHPAVIDPTARSYAHDVTQDAEAALDLVVLEAEALADRADGLAPERWAETATVAGGGEVAALDLLREAVRATAEHLRHAEQAVAAARR
jgi:hypothetical protein